MRSHLLRGFFGIFFVAFSLGTFAQLASVKGKVTDEKGNPLPGANIFVKGNTSYGTISDISGNYIIKNIPEGEHTIVSSFIGFNDNSVVVVLKGGETKNLDFTLFEKTQVLDEIIVIGYGVQKKSDKTGAVSQVKAEELVGGSLTDPIQALQGKAAGVSISKKGGDPNAGFSIRIRGSSGFDSNTQPLFVIDGVQGADPSAVAPEDIESYDILKDASSTAIYGSRGANGVIFITTKSGKKNNNIISFNSSLSVDQVANTIDMLTATELRNYVQTFDDPENFIDGGADVNWQDQIYRTGISQNYNLSFSGGNEKTSHYASVTRSDWEGVMKGTFKERTVGKINLTHTGLNDRLTISSTLQGTLEKNDYENYGGWGLDDIIYQALSHNPTDPVFTEDGDYYRNIRAFNYENPLAVIDLIDNTRDAKRFLGNLKGDLNLFEGMSIGVSGSYLRNDHESSYFRPKNVYATADNGWGKKEYNNYDQLSLEMTANYSKTFMESHSVNAIVGYSWLESNWNGFYAQAADPQSPFIGYNNLGSFIDINSNSIGSWAGMSRLIGFFGRVQYNYQSKYYFSASLRRDGSTKFGENNKWGWFPTASVGWNIHEEEFMSDVSLFDKLKLRASYGIAGNQEIGEYRSQVVFTATGTATDPETGDLVTTFGPSHNANPDLKWEKTTEINIGLDFAFMGNRINGSLEVYNKLTTDLLGAYQVPVPPNLARTTYFNSGSLSNTGIELNLQAFILDNANVKWKSNLNLAHNKTIILSLGDYVEGEIRREGYLSGRGLVGDFNYITGNIEGEELGAFYLPVFVTLADDGVFLFESTTGGITRNLADVQRQIVGSPLPDLEIGWSNNFTLFKNWTIDISLRSMIGNDVFNATRMFFDNPDLLPDLNALPEAIDWAEQGRNNGPVISDIYVEDGSFLKIDYLSLGYNFSLKQSDWVKTLRLYMSGNNLYTFTKYSGVDPETTFSGLSFGLDQYNVYPKVRTVTFGISATF